MRIKSAILGLFLNLLFSVSVFAQVTVNSVLRAPTIQVFNSGTALTYTTPTNGVKTLKVTLCAGGGGGSGSGNPGTGGNGVAGTTSTFSGATLSATGGSGGTHNGNGGGGGTGVNGDANFVGGTGAGVLTLVATQFASGVNGGTTYLGSGTNSGQGGVGAGLNATTTQAVGSSGGGGGCAVKYIVSPAATYTYTIGPGGAGGSLGTGGGAGSAGADGKLIVEEY